MFYNNLSIWYYGVKVFPQRRKAGKGEELVFLCALAPLRGLYSTTSTNPSWAPRVIFSGWPGFTTTFF